MGIRRCSRKPSWTARCTGGTCYRAANWQPLGFTSGYGRQRGPTARWRHHGQPKQVLVYPLARNVQARLRQPEQEPCWGGPAKRPPAPAAVLRSLLERLQQEPHCRPAGGRRYALASLLCLAASAHMAGYRGVTAYSRYATLLSQRQRQAAGCWFNMRLQRYAAPVPSTFYKPWSGCRRRCSRGPSSTPRWGCRPTRSRPCRSAARRGWASARQRPAGRGKGPR